MHKKTADALAVLKSWIETEKFGSSRFLPPERELCRQLDVGRGSLRAIMTELASEKYLTAVAGRGMLISYRRLRTSTLKILVVMPRSDRMYTREFVEIMRGMVAEAESLAADLVISFDFNDISPGEAAENLKKRRCDGVIFAEEINAALLPALETLKLPFVAANYEAGYDLPFARPDYRSIGRQAAGYLLSCGHKKLGFVGGSHLLYNEMFAGMEEVLKENRLSFAPELVFHFSTEAPLPAVKKELSGVLKRFSGFPAAVFCGRDRWAGYLFECCRSLGLKIPDDISVIGYDNTSWPEAEKEGLSTFEQPAFETGVQALRNLINVIDSRKDMPESTLLPAKLIQRSSVKILFPAL